MLSRHVDANSLVEQQLKSEAGTHTGDVTVASGFESPYLNRYTASEPVPKFSIPENGLESKAAYALIRDDLDLDGKPNLNLASFVTTYVEPEAVSLTNENLTKNLADSDEYPALMDIHSRCINILGSLWHAKTDEKPIGSATTGSSEAIHLGGLAMKRRWQEKRKAAGKDVSNPNIIMGANAQVALEKFARYFDVEARLIPVSKESHHCLDATKVLENVDENTIGIFIILGSTYTGHYEPVAEISELLDDLEARTGIDVPIHVDGASGGFVAPFCHPNTVWDFRIKRVHSINTSGHKYGLVSAGLGWIIWRSEEYLPKHLVFELKYLGGVEQSFTLNFSRPGYQVIQQYYNFLHFGREGYTRIQRNSLSNARLLATVLEASGYFVCLSEIHRRRGVHEYDPSASKEESELGDDPENYNAGLPVVAWKLADSVKDQYPKVSQNNLSTLLRVKGYIIPNYPLPPSEGNVEILRVVVRESMSSDLLERLCGDIISSVELLIKLSADHSIAAIEHIIKPAPRVSSLGGLSESSSQVNLADTGHKHGHYKGVC
ncbi:pyridoxal phosphate-dependent transferase [Lipomyces oligophaga]|uniref:pyridoxal phosphate-dependent transferase n=1 Tax=Lipomyces oligophaga TaxID=45792 RepID=UPI0034CF820F